MTFSWEKPQEPTPYRHKLKGKALWLMPLPSIK
jgi:hypothetical protein